MPERGRCFSMRWTTLSGPVAVESLEAAARNSAEEKESKRTSETPQGTWLGGAQRGSLWLCYAGRLVEK